MKIEERVRRDQKRVEQILVREAKFKKQIQLFYLYNK